MYSEELVIVQNEQPVTTSLKVAEIFKKEHKNVTRAIKVLMGSAQTCAHLFVESTYLDKQGKARPMYYMNRDGYTLLVMGFEGKDALQFKLAYMEAFNKMEAYIKEQQSKAVVAKPNSALDILQGMLDQMKEQEKRTLVIEQRLDKMEEEKKEATKNLLVNQYLSKEFAPDESVRENSRRLVNEYAKATGINQQDVWHEVYAKLYYQYHTNINSYPFKPGEKSKLDVAERIGCMEKIHAIISTMVYKLNKGEN